MAKSKILKPSVVPHKKDRPHRPFFTQEEWEEGVPISRGEFQQLQMAWYAISDLAELLKEVSCETATNPDSILRILTSELGEVVTELEAKFEKAEGVLNDTGIT